MRKQNSTFQSAFLSEAGSELENNDYFAFVELEDYACYVVADGLNDLPDAQSARIAIETVLLAFQERPSLKKSALLSYIKAADQELCKADSKERLKASVMVVVTDYEKLRYAYAGNTRLRLYRDGRVKEQSSDMSLGSDIGREEKLPEDVLSRHEERNNLYAYVGQGKGFAPAVSGKIKLENGDILSLYTRGIWENLDSGELDDVFSEAKGEPKESLNDIEDLLLSKQPGTLENYTFVAIFIDKVFSDPERKKKGKKVIIICLVVALILLVAVLAVWIVRMLHRQLVEDMNRKYSDAIEYIQDNNFIRAQEEAEKALAVAEKLRDRKYIQEISDYLKLIEALSSADSYYADGKYQDAQAGYVTAKERSRYADHVADAYIDQRLTDIVMYLSVYDYIQLGDTLREQGDYDRAEEKYLQAKQLATSVYFEEGRNEAMAALEELYSSRQEAEEAMNQQAAETAAETVSAAQLAAEGDKAFAEGDYGSANVYYAMAIEKYQGLGDDAHAELIQSKLDACTEKAEENKKKEQQAEEYVNAGNEQTAAGNFMEAKKQYLFAKNIYRELGMDNKVREMDGLIAVLDVEIEQRGKVQEEQEVQQ